MVFVDMLGFHGDAIKLSGETGTKLKSEILGKYYQKWWEITSGGKSKSYRCVTTIVEMNAGTGEVYLKDNDEIILGSSGHALELRAKNPNTHKLGIVLVEEDDECFEHLQNVIGRNWPRLSYSVFTSGKEAENFIMQEPSHLDEILTRYRMGNSLFLFDPLLSVSWERIEFIAKNQIKKYYDSGTEFLIFLFTSDFFLGRNEFGQLPDNDDRSTWSECQLKTAEKIDALLGDADWGPQLLNSKPNDEKMRLLVDMYKKKLRKWFRYVVPLPFIPKQSQRYDVFFCSNYEVGVQLTKNFYAEVTNNPKFTPNNKATYEKFVQKHPEKHIKKGRPAEWKILWKVIKQHEDGLCDKRCSDLQEYGSEEFLQDKLEWLEDAGYLSEVSHAVKTWPVMPKLYALDWNFVKRTLGVSAPPELIPRLPKPDIP